MELIFIRHAQGEHTVNLPKSLDIRHPALTEKGIEQALKLTEKFILKPNDIVIVSPTKRTIQTANIFIDKQTVKKYISPLVGPRMFPQNPDWTSLPCDEIYRSEDVAELYNDFEMIHFNENLGIAGINKLNDPLFKDLLVRFVEWIKTMQCTVYIITHDGTINNFRQILEVDQVTRADFLGETGWYKIIV